MTLKVIFKPPFALWFKGILTAALLCPLGWSGGSQEVRWVTPETLPRLEGTRIIATRLAGRCLGKNGVSLKGTVRRPAWPEQGCLGAVLERSFLGSAQGRPVDWDLSTA